jgi:hypothetical protein
MNHSIFAIELCMRLEAGSPLRAELHQLITNHPAQTSPGRKWQLLRRVTELLVENEHLFELGCWDFFDTDAKALADYDMWSNGMITEEGARTEPSWGLDGDEPRFMTFTLALLLAAGTQCERDLAALCEVPEDRLWKKKTFLKILRGLGVVNFAAVKSDVLYLIPGDESWGLTPADLREPKFDYLRPVEGGKRLAGPSS